MANKLNGFLDNFFNAALNPKGNVGDFAHASRLYVDSAFRLAPKVKFLYFVNFNFTDEALRTMKQLDQRHRAELNMLVKQVDLPQYRASVDVKNQYNRKKNVQTRVDYQPIQLRMHDDNIGITTMLMEAYYKYYFRDSSISNIGDTFDARGSYSPITNGLRYGLDTERRTPFFRDIKLYQFSRQEYTEYTLINPIVEQWGHDTMDQTDGSGIAENAMTLSYENVLYSRGNVGEDSPATFATSHYDKTPSPLGASGGGVSNLFGAGGVLDGASSVLGDLASGNANLGTLITAINTGRNARDLSLGSIVNQGVGLLEGGLVNALNRSASGVPGTSFPKRSGLGGNASKTVASAPADTGTAAQRAAKIASARAANSGNFDFEASEDTRTGGDGFTAAERAL